MLTLTREQGLAVGCYTAALSFLYVLPVTAVISHASSVLIGETGAAIIGALVLLNGMSKAFRWCLEALQ